MNLAEAFQCDKCKKCFVGKPSGKYYKELAEWPELAFYRQCSTSVEEVKSYKPQLEFDN
jgi:hypothetical protein